MLVPAVRWILLRESRTAAPLHPRSSLEASLHDSSNQTPNAAEHRFASSESPNAHRFLPVALA